MNKSQTTKMLDENYAFILKAFDFLVINLSLAGVILSLFKKENIIDIFGGFVFSILFLIFGTWSRIYIKEESGIFFRYIKLIAVFVLTASFMEGVAINMDAVEGYNGNHFYFHVLFLWYVITFILLLIGRLIASLLYRQFMKKCRYEIAIIGLTPSGLAMEKELRESNRYSNLKLRFYDDRDIARFGYITRSNLNGDIDKLLTLAKRGEVDVVYIALPMIANQRINDILARFSDTTVDTYLVPDLYAYRLHVPNIKKVGQMYTFGVFGSPFGGTQAFVKRIEDVVIGSLITLMILPIMAVIAIGIKMTSPGPVFFKQDRYGLGGKAIKVWKFRSMSVMENTNNVQQAIKNDPRVTPFGRFLRRTSLDELPQFFNVLQGTMSIVGPRPHAVAHNEQYRKIVDNYMIRQKVKPGITGLAQVSGYRGETDTLEKMEKRVQYDIRYMQQWSLSLDLKIIVATVFKGFVGESAY